MKSTKELCRVQECTCTVCCTNRIDGDVEVCEAECTAWNGCNRKIPSQHRGVRPRHGV